MTPTSSLGPALAALVWASAAAAQTAPPAPSPSPAPPASATPAKDPAVEARILELVRAGKCGPARAAALKAGEASLADQIGSMCGARPSDPFARRGAGRKGGR